MRRIMEYSLACSLFVVMVGWALRFPEYAESHSAEPEQFAAFEFPPGPLKAVFVAAGDQLIVGSLDLSGRKHRVRIQRISAQDVTQDTPEILRVGPPRSTPRFVTKPADLTSADLTSKVAANSEFSNEICTQGSLTKRVGVPVFFDTGVVEHVCLPVQICAGQRIRICLAPDVQQSDAVLELAQGLVRVYETTARPAVESLIGPVRDFDEDGFLTVILSRLDRRAVQAIDSEPIRGCVRSADFLRPSGDFSGDYVYLDYRLPLELISAILTHEVAHAAIYSHLANESSGDAASVFPAWLNEAIAHYVEVRATGFGTNLDRRLQAFCRSPETSPLLWSHNEYSLDSGRGSSRASGWLFLQYTMSQCSHRALTDLIATDRSTEELLNEFTGRTFESLFRDWTTSMQTESLPGRGALVDCRRLPQSAQQLEIRGTAAAYFQPASAAGTFHIQASAESQLQITVVTPHRERQSPQDRISWKDRLSDSPDRHGAETHSSVVPGNTCE